MKKYKGITYTVRKDGRLTKKITINGKTSYIYASSEQELEKKYKDKMVSSYLGLQENESLALAPFVQKWLSVNSVGRENGTVQEYEYLTNKYIIPILGNMKIKNIKIYDVKEMLKQMENIPTTAKKTLQLLKRILNEAVDNDIIIKNVAQNIKPPRINKISKKPLTLEEDNIILNSKNKYAPFFILMRYTGMRKEEIVPLTVEDIDLSNKTISINKAVTFIHNQPVIKSTKNRKSRLVPIPDIIMDQVSSLVENNKNGYIFCKETSNKMLTDSAIKRHLESFLYDINKNRENKIKFTCHQLRHSYCTMLYYAGVKIKKAQDLMGHSSAQMVLDVYTHLDSERENADEMINNYIKKLSKSCQNQK